MGSFVEINDTLRITAEQGFPAELDLKTHLASPYELENFQGKIFTFKAKPDIRLYQAPPVRNFLAQELDGKWIYWGLCLVHSVEHDYIKKETSGSFEIVRLNSPEQMKQMFALIDLRPELDYFANV